MRSSQLSHKVTEVLSKFLQEVTEIAKVLYDEVEVVKSVLNFSDCNARAKEI